MTNFLTGQDVHLQSAKCIENPASAIFNASSPFVDKTLAQVSAELVETELCFGGDRDIEKLVGLTEDFETVSTNFEHGCI